MSREVFLNAMELCCTLGRNAGEVAEAVFSTEQSTGLRPVGEGGHGRLPVGRVLGELPAMDDVPLALRGRNNALLRLALWSMRREIDAAIAGVDRSRIAIVLGSSTSGIGETERAFRQRGANGELPASFHYAMQELGTPARFVSHELGMNVATTVISTACSSAAKALASAGRLVRSGLADVVIAGGADSLCDFTLSGFSSLEAVSPERCQPFSANRRGINIGEGAALFVVSSAPGPVRLAGWGESADAHHMSAPDPTGGGARLAIEAAFRSARIDASQVGYVNLHGTATAQNDAMEALITASLYGPDTPCSSTKPMTGHALGAAGAIEAGLCWLMLARNPNRMLLPHWSDGVADPALPSLNFVSPGVRISSLPAYVASHSFAFGGSNAALILGAA